MNQLYFAIFFYNKNVIFRSVLLPPRPGDANKNGFNKWPFLSVQQWGENPRGNWMLIIENVGSAENKGNIPIRFSE